MAVTRNPGAALGFEDALQGIALDLDRYHDGNMTPAEVIDKIARCAEAAGFNTGRPRTFVFNFSVTQDGDSMYHAIEKAVKLLEGTTYGELQEKGIVTIN